MPESVSDLLESMRPNRNAAIMDLVEQAGIDVSGWRVKADGSPVRNPRANPNYCYEWAFGGGDEPTVLCVWHASLKTEGDRIKYVGNLRDHALRLDRVATERSNSTTVKSRARDQSKRANKFDSLVQRAYRKSRPVRLVLLVGDRRSETELGLDASQVHFRSLDSEPWYVHAYDDLSGAFGLVRGVPTGSDAVPFAPDSNGPHPDSRAVTRSSKSEAASPLADESKVGTAYVDQFSLPDSPEKRDGGGSAYLRSAQVRETVLRRAAGTCESCSEPGFLMDNGAVFLETHHVIPLSENGPDVEWNVVALCPNEHRQAHYGADRRDMRTRLVAKLAASYPGARDALHELLRTSPAPVQPQG